MIADECWNMIWNGLFALVVWAKECLITVIVSIIFSGSYSIYKYNHLACGLVSEFDNGFSAAR